MSTCFDNSTNTTADSRLGLFQIKHTVYVEFDTVLNKLKNCSLNLNDRVSSVNDNIHLFKHLN